MKRTTIYVGITVVVVLLVVAAYIAFMAGQQEAAAATAAVAAGTMEYARRRGRTDQRVDDAIKSTSEAVDSIVKIEEGSKSIVDDTMASVVEMSGEDKAREIDKIT